MIEQICGYWIKLILKNFKHKLQKLNNNQIKIFLNTPYSP